MARIVGIDPEFGAAAAARPVRGKWLAEVVVRGRPGDPAEIAREARTPLRRAVLPAGGPQVFLRAMKLPGDLDLPAVAETVRWQVSDAAPDREIRHAVTGRLSGQWCVLVGGVPKEAARGVPAGVLDLRVAALWRGAVYLLPREERAALTVVERSPSGWRVVAGREFPEFAREVSADAEAEAQRTLLYLRAEMGEGLRIAEVGRDLPVETAAVGLALWRAVEPRFNFLVRERRALLRIPAGRYLAALAAAGAIAAALPYGAAQAYRVQAAAYVQRAEALAPDAAKADSLRAEREKLEDWAAIARAFSASPSWPLMEDLRRAAPEKVWYVSVRAGPEESPSAVARPSGTAQAAGDEVSAAARLSGTRQAAGGQAASGRGRQVQPQLPERAAVLTLEGYSLDAASVGLLRDNLEALPWCAGVRSLRAEWDEEAGAFAFRIVAGIRPPEEPAAEAAARGASGR
ncbi:MAG: hypothetical protein ACPLRW_08790 [Moorellales bacterium]